MLKICGRVPLFAKEIRSFVRFLNEKVPVKEDIRLVIFSAAEILDERPDVPVDEEGDPKPYYGIYHPAVNTIWLAVGMFYPEYVGYVLPILAHEYYHAQQDLRNLKFDERLADVWCLKTVLKYIRYKRGNIK
jgi:hypothetical protein